MRALAACLLLPALSFTQPARPRALSELEKAADEFRIQTRNLGLREDSPRSARDSGSSKSRYHGRLFENFRNNFLDAVPHDVVQRGGQQGMLRRNQFGFNLTGPVRIPKLYHGDRATFFTLTYEGMRERIGRSYLRTIPTMEERTGDWAHVVDLAGQFLPIYDPQSTATNPAYSAAQPVAPGNLQYNRTPFPSNRIPAARLDPVAQRAVTFYPAPNTNAGPYFRNNFFIFAPEVNSAGGIITRVDHTVGDRHRFGVGVNYSNGVDGAAPWFPTAADPGSVPRNRRSRRGNVEHIFTRSARSINTVTFDASTDQSFNEARRDEGGQIFPNYRMLPYLSMGRSYPESRNARNTYVLTNSYSTRRESHRLRFIGQYIREQANSYWPQYPAGSFRFSPGLTSLPGIVNTGHAFASFLLGAPEFGEQSVVASPSYFRKSRYFAALRDQWELRKGLTFNFGLNLDMGSPRTEKFNRLSTVDLTRINPVNGLPGAMAVAGQDGYGQSFQPFLAKLEPSASVSWNVLGDTRSVLRAGYSRSYSPIPMYLIQWGTQAFNGQPAWVSLNPQLSPAFWLRDGPPPTRTFPDLRPESANNTVADLIEPSGRQPTYNSVSLSFEREVPGQAVVTATLAHSDGRNLMLGNTYTNPNAVHPLSLSFRDRLNDENFNRSQRPFPHYQRFDIYSSWPEGRYRRDAASVRIEKRASSGLSLAASYEYSKQMDNYSGPYGIQDYYNRRNEWSLTSSNNPHRLSLTYMYELPIGSGKWLLSTSDWRRYLTDGWSVSGVTSVQSGDPVALRAQFNNTGGVLDIVNVDVIAGANPHVAKPTPDLWFNPAAFAHPPDFALGTASRTHPTLRQPGFQNHDLSVTKRIAISAERSLEVSAVGLNFVNQGIWNEPDMIIGTAAAPNVNAGKIIGSRGGRILQLGMRFSF